MRVTPAPLSCGEFRVYCGASFAWLFGLFASRWHLKSSQLCTRRRHWRRCRPMRSASQCQRLRRQVTISASCAGWSRPRTSSSRAATNACAGRARPPSVSSAQCAAGLSWVCAGFSYEVLVNFGEGFGDDRVGLRRRGGTILRNAGKGSSTVRLAKAVPACYLCCLLFGMLFFGG